MEYTTQMDAARKGIFTPEMAKVAEKEHLEPKKLMALMAEGKVIIPCNKVHTCIEPNGLGSMLKTKINVNLGTSRDLTDLNMELEKVNHAVEMGAEAIMDLSSFGDTQKFRRKLTHECPAMIGTVPIYDAVVYYHKALGKITAREWIDIVRMHAEDGVDFMTIHCGINKETAKKFKRNRRGCLQDATDASQIEELITLGELTQRAWEKDVQIMIEGPGHMPLNQIAANMEIQKTLCHGAPFYVLGPIVTDIAPGCDHITSAIGGTVAAMNGASFLCYVTPAEHLRLPDVDDVKEGIIAARIAAHAADIAKGVPHAMDWDNGMAVARKKLDWNAMFDLAIDPEKARRYRESSRPEKEDTCSMCGNFCAVKNMNRILDGEIVSIFDE